MFLCIAGTETISGTTSVILTTTRTERRHSGRRRACYGGTLRLAAFLPEVECRLRDHSLTGARIVVAEEVALPRIVDLTVTCRNQTRRAEVVWRSGTQAGLAFLDVPEPRACAEPDARTEAAWVEVVLPGRLH